LACAVPAGAVCGPAARLDQSTTAISSASGARTAVTERLNTNMGCSWVPQSWLKVSVRKTGQKRIHCLAMLDSPD
jgi:hypothetical protein